MGSVQALGAGVNGNGFVKRHRWWTRGLFSVLSKASTVKIMLAEDNPHDRWLFRRAVNGLGDVTEAKDGQEALETWRAGEFDAVVVDDALPYFTGFEVAGEIRKTDERTPIIVWSGRENHLAELMARDVGAVFISKHQPIADLIAAITGA